MAAWVSRINWCKGHWCGSTYMVVRLSDVSSKCSKHISHLFSSLHPIFLEAWDFVLQTRVVQWSMPAWRPPTTGPPWACRPPSSSCPLPPGRVRQSVQKPENFQTPTRAQKLGFRPRNPDPKMSLFRAEPEFLGFWGSRALVGLGYLWKNVSLSYVFLNYIFFAHFQNK